MGQLEDDVQRARKALDDAVTRAESAREGILRVTTDAIAKWIPVAIANEATQQHAHVQAMGAERIAEMKRSLVTFAASARQIVDGSIGLARWWPHLPEWHRDNNASMGNEDFDFRIHDMQSGQVKVIADQLVRAVGKACSDFMIARGFTFAVPAYRRGTTDVPFPQRFEWTTEMRVASNDYADALRGFLDARKQLDAAEHALGVANARALWEKS